MTKNEWYAKLHELAFEDTRLDKIPFVCFDALAEGIAKIEAAQQMAPADGAKRCPECGSEIVVCMMGHYCGEVTPRQPLPEDSASE